MTFTRNDLTGGLATLSALLLLSCWGILWLYLRRKIVRRYEETGVTKTYYFQHEFFRVLSHASWKPLTYSLHLFLVTVLPMGLMRRSAGFRDLEDKETILRHFSPPEIRATILVWVGFVFAMLLGVVAIAMNRVFPSL